MVDDVFARELDLAVVIAAVEAHSALWQRHAKVVRLRVIEFAHDPDLRIGLCPKGRIIANALLVPSVVAVGIEFETVVDVNLGSSKIRLSAAPPYRTRASTAVSASARCRPLERERAAFPASQSGLSPRSR